MLEPCPGGNRKALENPFPMRGPGAFTSELKFWNRRQAPWQPAACPHWPCPSSRLTGGKRRCGPCNLKAACPEGRTCLGGCGRAATSSRTGQNHRRTCVQSGASGWATVGRRYKQSTRAAHNFKDHRPGATCNATGIWTVAGRGPYVWATEHPRSRSTKPPAGTGGRVCQDPPTGRL